MPSAICYIRRNVFYCHPESITTAGVGIFVEPIWAIDVDSVDVIASTIREALKFSRNSVPHPKVLKGLFDPMLRAAGVNSWSKFVNGAKCVEIEQIDERIKITPTRNGGAKDGFYRLDEHTIIISYDDEKLGLIVLSAFTKSE